MKHLLFVGLVAVSFVAPSMIKADENPNHRKDHITSIRWIIDRDRDDDIGVDDRYVVLVGHVTKKIKAETYLFTDGTGTIQLDSEEKLPIGEAIVVRGNIDQAYLGIGKLEVEVESWRANK